MRKAVMSGLYKCFADEVSKKGFEVIFTDEIKALLMPEQTHADMQILYIKNTLFLLKECTTLRQKLLAFNPVISSKSVKPKYPDNIQLNALYFNSALYSKLDFISAEIKEYCNKSNIKTVNVNQGYSRCSTLVVGKNSAITSDLSMEKALKQNGAEVLRISPGNIMLEGFDYGFIGGASAKLSKNTISFFGDITKHPDYEKIRDFCNTHNSNLEILCPDKPLTDLGGVVII